MKQKATVYHTSSYKNMQELACETFAILLRQDMIKVSWACVRCIRYMAVTYPVWMEA